MRLPGSSSMHLPSGSRTPREPRPRGGGGKGIPVSELPLQVGLLPHHRALPREHQARSQAGSTEAGDSWPPRHRSPFSVASVAPCVPASLPNGDSRPSRHRLTSYITPERVQREKLQDVRATANAF